MSFEVYSPDYTDRHEITHAVSVQMSRMYNDIGKLMLVVPTDDYNISVLQIGSMLYDTGTGETYTIQSCEYDTEKNYITANGYTTNWLLNRRAVISNTHITDVENDLYDLVRNNLRSMSKINIAESKGLTASADVYIYGGQLCDNIIDVLESVEYGHRMTWDDDEREFTFEIYSGSDLTSGIHAVVFSEEQGTAEKLKIVDDTSLFRNVFYILATFSDNHTELLTYGNATGDDAIEHWIESTMSQESDESDADFRKRVIWDCQSEAAEMVRRQNFSVVIDPTDLGTAYNLGDKIACASSRFGMQFTARITGVTYKLDATGESTSLTLGEPKLTLLDEMRLK